jgi:hypothetical protein
MKSYELLKSISEANPSVTHFMVRLYKKTLNPFIDQKGDFSYVWIDVEKVSLIRNLIESWEIDGFMVGLTNTIMTERGMRTLLVLDFSISQSVESENEIIEKISAFNKSGDAPYSMDGWLVKTNSSYHYIGTYVTSQENFHHFLGSSLLFRHADQDQFIVDDRWLGHQLKKGYGAVRIGRKDGKDFPEVIKTISST